MKPENILFVFLALVSICGMCSKEDAPVQNTPGSIMPMKGFLTTIGINGLGAPDSICIRNSSSGTSYSLTTYSKAGEAGGFNVRPKDLWELINTGANQWQIRNHQGYYLGYEFNQYASGNNKYSVSLDASPGNDNLFVMNRSGNQFFTQPVANTSVYLNSLPHDVQPPRPAHEKLRFLENRQMWFIVP